MIVAAFETSGRTTTVAVQDGTAIASRRQEGQRGHVEFCMPALLECLAELGRTLHEVDAFAVGIGPGMFTGLRVGVQTAKTLAATLDRPLIGVSSLAVLAAGVDAPRVVACTNAHRGEVFAAAFVDGVRMTPDAPMSPADAASLARAHDAIVAGDGPAVDETAFDGLTTVPALAEATFVLRVAAPRIAANETDDARGLEPLYLRRSEAEIKWESTGVVAKRPDRVKMKGERA